MTNLFYIFISAAVLNNFVLAYFLGISPLLNNSGRLRLVLDIGLAVSLIMFISTAVNWPVYALVLEHYGLQYLQYLVFMLVTAAVTLLAGMLIHRFNAEISNALGIYLPVITANSVVLGTALFMVLKQYGYLQSLAFALGGGTGFTLVLLVVAGIREELELSDVPGSLRGAGIILITAGCLALALTGLSGIHVR